MRVRLLIAFALGAVLGGAAVWLAAGPREPWLHHAAGKETVRLLVAKRELAYGTEIRPQDLQWVEWPTDAVPPGSFTSVKALLGEKGRERRVVLRPIEPGEPVLESKISGLGQAPAVTRDLGDGRRAVSISVDLSAGVAGFVASGDRVDIMLIREIEGQVVSSIIMQDVPVIAVGVRRAQPEDQPGFRSITVEVGIAEAQKLALAQQVGRLSLTLPGLGGEAPVPGLPVPPPERCKRPWSGYRDIPPNILIPDLCATALDGIIGPALGAPAGPSGSAGATSACPAASARARPAPRGRPRATRAASRPARRGGRRGHGIRARRAHGKVNRKYN